MLELLTIPAVLIGAALIPKKKNDKRTIQQVLVNRKVCFKKGDTFIYPKLKSTHDKLTYTTFIYTLPKGMPSEVFDTILPALKEALNREVEYEYEGALKLRVFKGKLPKKWDYDKSLIQPGTWEVPIGKNHQGVLYHNFDHYPHMLVGGVTRFGKTVFMKGTFHTLMMNMGDDVEFYILDLKAGLEFYKYKAFPQVKEVACDVFEAAETLINVTDELKRRELMFRDNGYTNILDTPIKKRTFIIVDEGAELSPNIVKDKNAKKYAEFCQAALSEIARIGGAVGMRLIYATQYPTKEAVPMQVKMNIVTRMSFICASRIASQVLLDDVGAEDLPSIPGRAIYMVEKKRIVQVPYIDDKMIYKMMEGEHETGKARKSVNDHRPIGDSEDQTPTTYS
ncbi:cell division protein FtsK (plasmid) [Cytobacillus spongiae]|uniref:FtsK/SpoIIIE domain-containing protein n=1 Tax=Cytobacillus spongiae TaxID=2901381 RepID=UPI001F36D8F4|nr:FtsK/SpoIIIE domain-containing protein [Cytobacillus spongiae]UII58135.1 cell division protein FtsK [Cytobacillus spongiae]